MLLVICSRFQLFVIYFTFYASLPQPIFCRTSFDTENTINIHTCFIDHTSRGCFEYIARHRFLSANASRYYFREFEYLIHKGDILNDGANCQYNAIDMAVGCWALNRRLLQFPGGFECAACGPASEAWASPRVMELFCSPPSKPPTIIQTVQIRTTEEWTTMSSLLMRDHHHVSSSRPVVPIWLHQGAWPLALVITLSSALLFSLLVTVGLALFFVVVRAWRSRPTSSIGGELPIEMRGILISQEHLTNINYCQIEDAVLVF